MAGGGGAAVIPRAPLVVLALALAAGTVTAQEATGPAPAPEPDRLLVSDTVYTGWKYFQVYCARCHGDNAKGSMAAPDLTYSVSADGGVLPDSFAVMVRRGASNGEMKGFEDLLDQPLIDALWAYVKARSDDLLAPGRPHRRPSP